MTEKTSGSLRYLPLAEPSFGEDEAEAVRACVASGWVSTAGSLISEFEQKFAERLGVRHAVATNSGTASLHLALLAAGVGPEDEVITSTMTFIAPVNAISYVGAHPVFIDAEPDYWQLDPAKLRQFLEDDCKPGVSGLVNSRSARRVKAILPVHILGNPCDMTEITRLAIEFDLPVVEDATEGLGASWRDRPVGTIGKVGCFSFNGNKIITTGGGGMVVTEDDQIADRMRHLGSQAKLPGFEYIHDDVGYNYRMTNLVASLGVVQLGRLDEFVAAKRATAQRYADGIGDIPGLTLISEPPGGRSAFWMFTILIDESEFGCSSRDLLQRLEAEGIQSRPLWQPMHMSRPFRGAPRSEMDVADRLFSQGLSIPCSVGITGDEQDRVINAVRAAAR